MKEDVKDICSYVLSIENMSNLKLQKILYFIQALHLLKFEEPAFNSPIEAWPYGPVVPEAYFEFKYRGLKGDSNINLNPYLQKIVHEIVKAFEKWEEFQMVDLTHKYEVWIEKINDSFGDKTMSHEEILNYHKDLMMRKGRPF